MTAIPDTKTAVRTVDDRIAQFATRIGEDAKRVRTERLNVTRMRELGALALFGRTEAVPARRGRWYAPVVVPDPGDARPEVFVRTVAQDLLARGDLGPVRLGLEAHLGGAVRLYRRDCERRGRARACYPQRQAFCLHGGCGYSRACGGQRRSRAA